MKTNIITLNMDRKESNLSIDSKNIEVKRAPKRIERKVSQSKYSEVGNMATAKNKSQDLQLMKSLDHYDKQRLKAARSIEFAQRSFKNNLKTLNNKLGDVQFDDPRLRRYHGREQRRQSSPAPLSHTKSTDSLDVNTKGNLSPQSEMEMPLSDEARGRFLSYHRHSLPPENSSLRTFQDVKTNKALSLKPDSINMQSRAYFKSASWSNLQETLSQAQQNFGNSKSVSFSLPKIDSVESCDRTVQKKVTFSEHKVLPSIKKPENLAANIQLEGDASVETLSSPESPRGKKNIPFRLQKDRELDPKNPVIDEEVEVPIILVSNNH